MSTVRTAPKPARGDDFWARARKSRHSPEQIQAMQRAVGIWTRASGAGLQSPFLGSRGGGAWRGLVESRTAALDEARAIARDLGRFGEERLRAYANGLTLAEMAARFTEGDERRMATILDSDLTGLVRHFQGREGDA